MCYLKSLELDAKNSTVLRDLLTVQVHLMDWKGALHTISQQRNLQRNNVQFFLFYIVFLYLCGDVEQAIELVKSNEELILKEKKPIEISETHLFLVFMLMKIKKWEEALSTLNSKESAIVDKQVLLEYKAEIYQNLGKRDEAKKIYELLIERNNSCKKYYLGYLGEELTNTEETGRRVKE